MFFLGDTRSSRIGEFGGSATEDEGGGFTEMTGEVGGVDW